MIAKDDLLSGLTQGRQRFHRALVSLASRRGLSYAAVLLVFLALAFSVMPRWVVLAGGPFTANTSNDTHDAILGNGACADTNGQCSLRAAIEEATALGGATTINLPSGTYNLSLGELKTGNTAGTIITLSGASAGTTIINQTDGVNRVFNVDYGLHGNVTLTIQNVTIQNGIGGVGGGGGAVLDGDVGDVLNLTNVVFSNNQTSSFNGGAISFTGGGTLNVQNTTFTNNSSPTGNGGAIHFLQTQAGGLTITNSTFSGNSATGGALGGQGGAINVGCNICSPFSISGSTFTNNTAVQVGASGGQGGAIMLGSGALTFNFNRVVDNHAASGSGIYHGGSDAVTAPNNWWGCNSGPGSAGCDTAVNASGTLTTHPYIVLAHTASPNSILVNQSTTLTASFLQNSAGAPLSASNLGVLSGLPITFSNAVLGSLSGAQTTIQPNGTATATFTAGHAIGTGHADAKVDNETATATITITEVPITGLSATDDSPTPLGRSTTLTASLVTGSDVIYQWDLGDGNAIVSGNPVTHSYSVTGTFTAIVTATNAVSSMRATTQVTITAPITNYTYLPLVARNDVSATDLTGEGINAPGDSVHALKNGGR